MRGKLDIPYLFACGILAVFAFAFNWATGHRGIFFEDQSAYFDGGWRILQGQTPYKDFLIPFGPVTFWIQGLFFRLFGVNWMATVLPACVFNVLATLSAIRIVRVLSGGSRPLALCSGFATAICFQAPFGTIGLEQTAMFFDFLALQAAVESLSVAGYRRSVWQLAGGFTLVIAALSKQNYGFFFIPVVFAILVAGELPDVRQAFRSVLLAASGMAAATAIFLGWVWMFSDFPSFVQHFVVLAGQIGRSRLGPVDVVKALSFEAMPNAVQVDLIGVLFGGIALFLAWFNLFGKDSTTSPWRQMAPASAVAILLPWFRSVTQATTFNEWQNDFAFVGLGACLGIGLMLRLADYVSVIPVANRGVTLRLPSARAFKTVLCVVAGAWGTAVMLYEGRDAWIRKVQQFEPGTRFHDSVHVRGMEGLRWGEPTLINPSTTLQKADFESLFSWLSAKRSTFFVVGDSTILYGLLGTRSPQPLLYFAPNHSFLENEIPRLDETILTSLERNRVSVVIREKVMWERETSDAYPMFPRIWAWFTSRFVHLRDFGNYEVWELKPDGSR